jgi:hypothetical protein
MTTPTLEAIFRALNQAGARYLIVGGVAVVAHGYRRYTHDLDLVFDFSTESLEAGLEALRSLGYRPRIPVDLLDFARPELRKQWQEDKGLKVFNVFSDRLPDVTIDLFPVAPFDFEVEYQRAAWYDLVPGLRIPVANIERLIAMKTEANRPLDHVDIDKLRKIQQLADEA